MIGGIIGLLILLWVIGAWISARDEIRLNTSMGKYDKPRKAPLPVAAMFGGTPRWIWWTVIAATVILASVWLRG